MQDTPEHSPMKRALSLSRVYRLLEPGPVVLLSSSRGGKANVMAMSWHMMVDFEPPLVACIISDRNYSYETVRKTRECVIAIPTVQIARKVVACGNCSGRDVDKFQAIGLTPIKAAIVKAPLIAECYANLECVLADTRMANRYGMLLWEVKKAWIDPGKRHPRTIHHLGYGTFMIAGRTIHIASRMR
jgi:flavin reductase (DIM6/NTAB) family NADH-FMN oxidoreductase RutF